MTQPNTAEAVLDIEQTLSALRFHLEKAAEKGEALIILDVQNGNCYIENLVRYKRRKKLVQRRTA